MLLFFFLVAYDLHVIEAVAKILQRYNFYMFTTMCVTG